MQMMKIYYQTHIQCAKREKRALDNHAKLCAMKIDSKIHIALDA